MINNTISLVKKLSVFDIFYFKSAAKKLIKDSVNQYLPNIDKFYGTYHNDGKNVGVHSVVTLEFSGDITSLISNYGREDIGVNNEKLFNPFILGTNIIKIGNNTTPGNVVLEEGQAYELFKTGATSIPALTKATFTTVADGGDSETEFFIASGVGFPITDSIGAKASIKYESNDGGDNKYEFKTGVKYKF